MWKHNTENWGLFGNNTINLSHLWISAILTSNVEMKIIKLYYQFSTVWRAQILQRAHQSMFTFFGIFRRKTVRLCLVMDGDSIENIYKESLGCLQKFALKKYDAWIRKGILNLLIWSIKNRNKKGNFSKPEPPTSPPRYTPQVYLFINAIESQASPPLRSRHPTKKHTEF